METSEQVNEIATAAAKMQGQVTHAERDGEGVYKNKYATLSSMQDAAQKPLAENSLYICQSPFISEKKVGVETVMLHSSGQYFKEKNFSLEIPRMTIHEIGSHITYLKKYSYGGFVGITPAMDDDDGQKAQSVYEKKPKKEKPKPSFSKDELKDKITELLTEMNDPDLNQKVNAKVEVGNEGQLQKIYDKLKTMRAK